MENEGTLLTGLNRKKPLFIAGIGTDAGKTLLSAVLCESLKADYWKPVQAGSLDATDSMEIKALLSNEISVVQNEAYLLPYPLSPHASADKAGVKISLEKLALPHTDNPLLIEGAGGLMVPLNDSLLMIDLIRHFRAEVVLISRHYLGSINHTLLSAEALKMRGIVVKGIWFNGNENYQTEDFILNYTGLKFLGRLPEAEIPDREFVKKIASGIDSSDYLPKAASNQKRLSERDQKVIWHPFTQAKTAQPAIGIVKAEGCWLIAENGERYLDGTASWWVNAHGHGNAFIASEVGKQAATLEHIIFAGFTHEPAVLLAEKLLTVMPGKQEKIFYSDNGSTSVEVALKMALQYFYNRGETRQKIVAFRNAYHGDTFGAMSVGARNAFNSPFASLLFEVHFIDPPEISSEEESINQLEKVLRDGNVAAFIFEPLVQGANGMRMHDASALGRLIAMCRINDVITIADEVFTGFYRTGKMFACNYLEEQPDLICLSKTITGGTLPLGVTAAPAFIYDAFLSDDKLKTFFHGHSFTANPIACSAALASFKLLNTDECQENIARISKRHIDFSKEISGNTAVEEIRVLGTILAIELNSESERGYLNPLSEQITEWFFDRNIYLRPLGNVLYCTPPYIIIDEELDMIYKAIREFLIQKQRESAHLNG